TKGGIKNQGQMILSPWPTFKESVLKLIKTFYLKDSKTQSDKKFEQFFFESLRLRGEMIVLRHSFMKGARGISNYPC
ncbi:MAG: hypothetical protein M3P82_06985, partial [Bacteroidota bacterium]|nr:hypothetical protein [Bacteroidota bacterium]